MKRLFFFIALVMTFSLVSCKDKSVSEEVTVISVEEVRNAMGNGEFQLIDVRTVEEFNEGHLKGAKNVCVTDDDFKEKVAKLDRNEPVYLYCRSGRRSARAGEILREMGFTEIYDMDGGILKWNEEDFELEK